MFPLFLYQREILPYPLLYISEYFEKNRRNYYDLLNQVSEKGDWETWLKFFLYALKVQSRKTGDTILKILLLYEKLKKDIVAVNSIYAINLLDVIFATPIISYAIIKKRLKTKSNQTIYNLLEKFTKAGIIKEISGRRRNKIYIFNQLLEILK